MPPPGGIFLSPELCPPPHIEKLIVLRPKHRIISEEAARKLDQLFPPKKDPTDPYEVDANTQYRRFMHDIIYWTTLGRSPTKAEQAEIGRIEDLQEKAGLYQDTCATIRQHSEKLVELLRVNLPIGSHMIGQGVYEIVYDDIRYQNRLTRFDGETGLKTIFNYYEATKPSLMRHANLDDYIALIFDVGMEQLRPGSF